MRFFYIVFLSLSVAGCAGTPAYNPMQVASQEELSLNESGFKQLQNGMTLDQVHQAMGQALVIGYAFQSPDYKPLTVSNPYKSGALEGTDYFIEYYIDDIRQPDGDIHDDQLRPLVFKDGKLIGSGWPLLNSLRPANPAS